MTNTRYALFAGLDYYPHGGWLDYRGAFATINDAKAKFLQDENQDDEVEFGWAQVVDLEMLAVVAWYDNGEDLRDEKGWR